MVKIKEYLTEAEETLEAVEDILQALMYVIDIEKDGDTASMLASIISKSNR